MISVVVCSINQKLLSDLQENIEKTIGIPYELNAVDNNIINNGICQVYNQAAKKSKYDILCFVHEDVLFHTIGWGKELFELLSDPQIGLVGVSGTIYKSNYPSSWSACDSSLYRMNCIQHFTGFNEPKIGFSDFDNSSNAETALVDGVFMATRREIWQHSPFDEINFKGFHCYDLDFSYSIRKKYKVVVSHNILLEHFSEGSLNKNWVSDTIRLHKKWKNELPIIVGTIPSNKIRISNYIALQNILSVLLKHKGYSLLVLKYYCILIFKYLPLNKFRFTKTTIQYLFTNNKLEL